MDTTITKRRKPWLAAVLSFATTGLGQFYNGQWKKGLIFFAVEMVLGFSFIYAMASFHKLLAGISFLLIFNLFVAGEAYISAKRTEEYRLGSCNRWWVYAILIIANILAGSTFDLTTASHFHKSFKVPSESMLQTLQVGDHFMSEILSADDQVGRGNIVVFDEPNSGRYFVKRVVALPGDTIELRNKNVFINGKKLEEPYARHTKHDAVLIRDTFGPYHLAPNEYFMLGDNREASYDSRWIGPIKRTSIRARAKYLYFPGNIGGESWFKRLGAAVR